MERFIRNEQFFGEINNKIINNSKIMIIGLGGVGGYAAECLARTGVNNLVLVDFDVVQESNINRQIIAVSDTINIKKIDAFSTRIQEINPYCNIARMDLKIDKNNIEFLPKDVDYVIDAIDDLEAKILIYEFCLENNIKFVSSMGMAKRINPSKVSIISLNKTQNDPLAKKIRYLCRKKDIDLTKIKVVASDEDPIQTDKLSSVVFVPASAGILCAYCCINDLIK